MPIGGTIRPQVANALNQFEREMGKAKMLLTENEAGVIHAVVARWTEKHKDAKEPSGG